MVIISAENECNTVQIGACGANADCAVVNGSPQCTCQSGFEGDPDNGNMCEGKDFIYWQTTITGAFLETIKLV